MPRDPRRETIRFAPATDEAREAIRTRSQLPTLQFRAIRPVPAEWGWRRWVSVGATTAILSALAGVGGAKLANHLDGGLRVPHYVSTTIRALFQRVR